MIFLMLLNFFQRQKKLQITTKQNNYDRALAKKIKYDLDVKYKVTLE